MRPSRSQMPTYGQLVTSVTTGNLSKLLATSGHFVRLRLLPHLKDLAWPASDSLFSPGLGISSGALLLAILLLLNVERFKAIFRIY